MSVQAVAYEVIRLIRLYTVNKIDHGIIIAMIPILVATFVLLLILVLLTMTINYTILIKTEEKDLNFHIKG